MSLFERIKNIRRNNLQEEKMKFPGGTGDIGFNAPKRREKVQKRLSRADDVYGTPDPFDPDYDKKVKKVDGRTKIGKVFKSTKPVTTSAPGFGKGLTPGEIRVKGLERKAFKKTQPSDIKKTKGYKRYAQLSKEIKKYKSDVQDFKDRNLPGGPRKQVELLSRDKVLDQDLIQVLEWHHLINQKQRWSSNLKYQRRQKILQKM